MKLVYNARGATHSNEAEDSQWTKYRRRTKIKIND